MESLQIGVATHFGAATLFSMRTGSLASSQRRRSVDTDAQCKQALKLMFIDETVSDYFFSIFPEEMGDVVSEPGPAGPTVQLQPVT